MLGIFSDAYSLLRDECGEVRRRWLLRRFLRFRVNYWALGCSQRGLHRRGFLLLAQLLRSLLRDRGDVLYRRQLVPILLQMVVHHRVRVLSRARHLLDVRVDALSTPIVALLEESSQDHPRSLLLESFRFSHEAVSFPKKFVKSSSIQSNFERLGNFLHFIIL